MEDRGNIAVKDIGDVVWLYSHWGGTELGEVLARALGRKKRWRDAPYLTRIIFDEMTKGRQGEELGFGISTHPTDWNHDTWVVNVIDQEVQLVSGVNLNEVKKCWKFKEFIGQEVSR